MVPVGGSIIYSHKKKDLIEKINNFYPGRASGGPIMDLFITYLEMGSVQMQTLIKERKENFDYLKKQLDDLMPKYGERVINTTKGNKISLACTLKNLEETIF